MNREWLIDRAKRLFGVDLTDTTDPIELLTQFYDVLMAAAQLQPFIGATVTAETEVAHARTIHIQLVDGASEPLAGVRLVRVMVNPDGANEVSAATETDVFGVPTVGAIQQEVDALSDYWMLTDATGKIVFTITHDDDAETSRWVAVAASGLLCCSEELVFDAVVEE